MVTPNYKIVINEIRTQGQHARVYNAPSVTTELAAIMIGDENDTNTSKNRTITVHTKGGDMQFISSAHSSYDTLSYVLFHMAADRGWTYTLPLYNNARKNKFLSPSDFYCYRLQLRDPKWTVDINTHRINQDILSFGRLLSDQYWVDQYVKIEEQRLKFIANNQKKLKQELYSGLADAVQANEQRDAGTYVVLPSSHTGSPRYQSMKFQDAMAIVRKYKKPDLFITFTCNPYWPEIISELRPGESPWMRKDLTVRVFQIKLQELLEDLLVKKVLGQ